MPDSPNPARKRKVMGWRRSPPRPALSMTPCVACASHPKGEKGHAALAFYVDGPFPGRQIFKCTQCDARWVRHYGSTTERFAWTLYTEESRNATPPRKTPA